MKSLGFSTWLPCAAFATLMLIPLGAFATLSKPSAVGVKFIAAGPAGVSIVGETENLIIADDGKVVSVSCPLDTLHTGIGLRDRHMKEKYLEVEKFPRAELHVDRSTLAFPATGNKSDRDAAGQLTLHGKTKVVRFHYTAQREGEGFTVSAKFRVNMKDYGIEVPSYLGVTVKPDVDVSVQFHVQGA